MLKRSFDIFVATVALLVTWPLIALGALAIKLSSPGPAFYRATRAGCNGHPFVMYKLRTMRVATDSVDRRITAENDDRVTPVGKLLRACKMDELPQFWNVLRGDMSVVGPRPEDWHIVQQHYTAAHMRALAARPGLTSPADVRWYPDQTHHDPPPADAPMQEYYVRHHLPLKLAEEIRYIEEQTLLLDMRVLWQTLLCVIVYTLREPEKKPVAPVAREFAHELAPFQLERSA